ncbi:MAG: serine--tRNA ligase [Campylobacterales bacterium]
MIDLKLLEKEFDATSAKLRRRGVAQELLETAAKLFEARRRAKQELEKLQALQNEKSRLFGTLKREGGDIEALKVELEANKEAIAKGSDEVRHLDAQLEALAMTIPNIPDDDTPDGEDEEGNVEIARILEPPVFSFEPKEHHELGAALGWLDFEAGVKLAKSRFTVLRAEAARLQRALASYMLDFNRARGFEEVGLPYLVNRETMTATGQLPKFEEDLFRVPMEEHDLFLIPTSEVPLVNLFRDTILTADELPIRLTALTPCFRKEAGAAGRDTRGMIRQHQFDKVEIVAITTPEQSDAVFDEMLACASDLLTSLGLPHRLMRLCAGDMGFGAAKTVDIEVWLPGQGRYREISSVSNVRDFQARRGMIRYKEGKKTRLVHTLNGSSLAVGRTLIALMENYQQPDGTIAIPEVLRKYL